MATTKARASEEKAVASSDSKDEAVAEATTEPEAMAGSPDTGTKTCADCGSHDVAVSTGEGDAARDYCQRCAPVNAPKPE